MSVAAERGFTTVCALEDLPVGSPVKLLHGGRELCAVRSEDEVRVFADSCPHRGHPLSEGKCDAGVLRCALHGWEFDLDSGAAVSPAAPFGLELREVRVRDGMVELEDES